MHGLQVDRAICIVVLVCSPLLRAEWRPRPAHKQEADVNEICEACSDIWMTLNPHTTGDSRRALDAPEPLEAGLRCYTPVDRVCSDCKNLLTGCMLRIEDMANQVGIHHPERLISSEFSFCRGHSANSSAEMSLAAWSRVISWKLEHCVIPTLDVPRNLTPLEIGLGHLEGIWYNFSRYAEYARQNEDYEAAAQTLSTGTATGRRLDAPEDDAVPSKEPKAEL